jgi:putative cell wall-binding protein
LFTPTAALPQETRDEINRAVGDGGVVYLLGGNVAISDAIETELANAGYDVTRLEGGSRVETSIAVAREVIDLGGSTDTIAVARAFGPQDNPTAAWADSVSGGAWAAGADVGLVVTDTDSLAPAVAALLAELNPQRTVLLGAEAALSMAVEEDVPNPDRVFGDGRSATAAAVARELIGIVRPGPATFVAVNVGRADGWLFGLASAGLAADEGAALLAVGDTAPPESLLLACDPESVELLVAGHTDVVAESVVSQIDNAGAC